MLFEVEQALRSELVPGEHLVWSSIPVQGLRFRTADLFFAPFSLMWAGFAFFWEYSAFTEEGPWFFVLWGIPFVLVGLYMTVGRFFFDSATRRRTCYGVTDQRVIIMGGLFHRTVKSVILEGLREISLEERADHSGTITFGPAQPSYSGFSGKYGSRMQAPAFELAADVRKVHDLIRATQRAAAKS
jgi:hypothetical protein